MFADISGFTKMSERLAKQGKVGAEEVVSVINSTFTSLLAVAYGEGGGLLKFGGDALLLFFSESEHAVRAARAASRMRRTLREIGKISTSAGAVSLRISIGIHSDDFDFYLVGDSHQDLLISGPAASRLVMMEQNASAGEILMSPTTCDLLPAVNRGLSLGPGILLKGVPAGAAGTMATFSLDVTTDVSAFIPKAVREHLEGGGEGAAHRQVGIMFLHYGGLDALAASLGADNVTGPLHELVCLVQEAAEKHEVSYLDSDIDADGGKIYLAAGAPVARDDDEGRMLLTARHILDGPPPLPVRIGLNRGHVFTGDIGPQYRKTYTFMGDAVNLAARMMSAAKPGEIVATSEVLAVSGTSVEAEAMEPFKVKGKSRPVEALRVGRILGRKGSAPSATAFVGRDNELRTLIEAARQAHAALAYLVDVVGDAGIGKSRLVEEFKRVTDGLQFFDVHCEPYEVTSPYSVFRRILRSMFDVPVEAPAAEAKLRALTPPELQPWLPLIAIVFGVDVPPTTQTANLDDSFKRARLEESLLRLLRISFRDPTVLIFEDVQWMDEASSDLLRHIGEDTEGASMVILVTRRPSSTGFIPVGAATVQLPPLEPSAVRTLIDTFTEESPLRPHEINALIARGGGNPLFIQELISSWGSGSAEDLPDSLEKAITIRIDKLPPRDRMALRKLSVLGPTFDIRLVPAVLKDGSSGEDSLGRLAEFLDRGGSAIRFRQTLMRDAAYESLPYFARRELHAMAGDRMLELSPDPEQVADILAIHFFEARRYEAVWKFARIASRRARAAFANVEAARFLERALEASRRIEVDAHDRASTWEGLAEVRMLMGEFEGAASALKSARHLIGPDPVENARLISKQVRIPWRTGRLSMAIRWINRGLTVLQDIDSKEAGQARADLFAWFGSIRQEQGRNREAIDWCRKAIAESQTYGEMAAFAQASNTLDVAAMMLGELEDYSNSEAALATYTKMDELSGRARVLNNLGGYAYYRGRWDEALERYEQAGKDRMAIGDEVTAALSTYNIAEILSDQGKLEEARKQAKSALQIWRAAGDKARAAFASALLARIAYRMGEVHEALPLLDEARATFEYVGAAFYVSNVDGLKAELFLAQGDAAGALQQTEPLIEQGTAVGPQTAFVQRIRGLALLRLGDEPGARVALQASLEAARSLGLDYEAALTMQALATLGGPDAAQLQGDSDSILDGLGVIRP